MNIKNNMISIIVPIFNAEKSIHKCITSLIHQSYKHIEILLIDDGSTDQSLEICKKYESEYQNIIVLSQRNSGVSNARNYGLSNSNGAYIMFVDSDDYIMANMCFELINALELNKAEFAMCGYSCEYNFENLTYMTKDILPNIDIKNKSDFNKYYGKLIENKLFLSIWGKLFDNTIIKHKNLYFNSELIFCEDMLFLQSYFLSITNFSFTIVNKPYYKYFISEKSSLSKKFDSLKMEKACFIFNESLENCSRLSILKSTKHYISLHYFRILTTTIEQIFTNYPEQRKNIRDYLRYKETKLSLKFLSANSLESLSYLVSFGSKNIVLIKIMIKIRRILVDNLRRR